jgi:tetratricopeptide (TPR) repeat protein
MINIDVHHSIGEPATIEIFAANIGKRGFDKAGEIYQEMHNKDSSFKPDERALNSWGYQLANENWIKEAIAILRLVTEIYPESANGFDSLAEVYEENKEKELAIKNYKRSLELNPQNGNAVQHLKGMGIAIAVSNEK